ncbi:putative protein N(5)-glutamine methyltransferase [Serinibacter arcticus]|uniref:Methyltransferase small domain-containing protein n=1 Tax=Serinibacter arcticus TaxID=1655435 RepID=A0A2U1ZUA5_9MICO|nr:putative protein N(5)-glutamine methyltransferase [Serinibacter arcticus]PWD50530.1 putative protein N(5)-glutamine methyltransferase [Serinibacter arcticus]
MTGDGTDREGEAAAEALVLRLRAAGCVFAEEEAALLLGTPPSDREALVARRVAGEPLEHVLGWVELDGVRLAVGPGVFVPRQRSLLLVAEAARRTPPGSRVLDLCCGNGALGRLLAERVRGLGVHASDVDPRAVALAAANLAPVGGTAVVGDLFDGVPAWLRGTLATITANVPYVPSGAEDLMPRDVRFAEPRSTRDGGVDGLDVLRRVAAEAPAWLAHGGVLLSEVAEHQAAPACAVLAAAGLRPETVDDDEGTAVVIGTRPA